METGYDREETVRRSIDSIQESMWGFSEEPVFELLFFHNKVLKPEDFCAHRRKSDIAKKQYFYQYLPKIIVSNNVNLLYKGNNNIDKNVLR
ncbi:MAG: hypothetical protein J6C84_00110 [Lachnospiraceae bacterium]|nr:hypothetical protein [Lachnospiraceae bacterium]